MDFEITKREVLASISIIAVMLMIGVMLSGKITSARLDRDEVYNKAVKIESTDLFEYGMRTNIGNAFVYGDLEAVDTVTYPEIGGEYIRVKKIKEEYTRHTRQVAHTRTVNGKTETYYTTEVYWSWDMVDSESITAKEVSFLGVTFDTGKIDIPSGNHIDTIYKSSHIRYQYYGVGTKYTGTIFTDLRDGTISDGSNFYNNRTIDETVEHMKAFDWTILFWVGWSILIIKCVCGFYYIDNWWLE